MSGSSTGSSFNMNMGMADGNLSSQFQKLTPDEQETIKNTYNKGHDITAAVIGTMDKEKRAKLKDAILKGKTLKSEAADKVVGDVKAQGMEDGELEGDNKLVFIGAGKGGSSNRDEMPTNMLMKNSTYYAATKVGTELKQITSIDNKVVDGNNVEEIIDVTKQAIIKIADVKGDNRTRLTVTLSNILTPLLPDGINNLKFANKMKQSLQIVLGYTVNADKTISGKGRIQFVPQVGIPVSSIINIKDNQYSFDNKDILANKEAGKTAEEVLNKLAGVTVTHDPDATAAATAVTAAAAATAATAAATAAAATTATAAAATTATVVTPQGSPQGSPHRRRFPPTATATPQESMHEKAAKLGAERAAAAATPPGGTPPPVSAADALTAQPAAKIEEQVKLASAAAAAANASADRVEKFINISAAGGGPKSVEAAEYAKQAKVAANAAFAAATAAKDDTDIDAVQAARKMAEDYAREAETAAVNAEKVPKPPAAKRGPTRPSTPPPSYIPETRSAEEQTQQQADDLIYARRRAKSASDSNPDSDSDSDDDLSGGKKRKTHRKKAKKNKSKKAKAKKTKAKKTKGGRRTIKRRIKPKRGKC
jgi:hypothetical protein